MMSDYQLILGDCLEVMPTLEAGSVDAIVTDPPYGLSFMGRDWDHGVPGVPFWETALRVAKPGAMMLAFGGTRTHHRLMVAIEDAGWEIRDCLMWLYGSGFPKSMDIGKAIDKAAGVEREVIGVASGMGKQNPEWNGTAKGRAKNSFEPEYNLTTPATDAAKQWDGWGTNLKPAWEPIILARKPLSEKTITANVLRWGTGGLNIDACRIDAYGELTPRNNKVGQNGWKNSSGGYIEPSPLGRWPANLLLDEEAARLLDEQSGLCKTGGAGVTKRNNNSPVYTGPASSQDRATVGYEDTATGASRFFYVAKASRADRNEGLEGMPERTPSEKTGRQPGSVGLKGVAENKGQTANPFGNGGGVSRNHHPTVKPTQLMRYLCRLITPANGIVLDPFAGSGSTGKAAILEGFQFIGIESDPAYHAIATRRIEDAAAQPMLFEVTP